MTEQILHGGDLIGASTRYKIPVDQWLDLSTGINPDCYPMGDISADVFQRLPYQQPKFLAASANYYGSDQFIAVNGSQPVIQALPKCLDALPVLLPEIGYDEHRLHWARHGNALRFYKAFDRDRAITQIEAALAVGDAFHLVVINPNNPSGLHFEPERLAAWAEQLPEGGCLIVDEAFIDVTPEDSVLRVGLSENMVVLRSFGKFFGLAGVRLGFVFANAALRETIRQRLGIWQVNGIAQAVATDAFADTDWQRGARSDIGLNMAFTERMLAPLFDLLKPSRVTQQALFTSWQLPAEDARRVQHLLATEGVLVRLIPMPYEQALIRTGIISRYDWDGIDHLERAVAHCIELLKLHEVQHV